MKRITIEEYMEDRVNGQYDYLSNAAANAKRKYHILKALEICFAAAIPFLSAMMSPNSSWYMKVIVGFFGVAITFCSGMLMLFKYHENWVNFRGSAEALKSEKFLFLTRSGQYKSRNAEAMFMERIEIILGQENQKWQNYVVQTDDLEGNSHVNMSIKEETAAVFPEDAQSETKKEDPDPRN